VLWLHHLSQRSLWCYGLLAFVITLVAGCGPSAEDLLRDLRAAEIEKRQRAIVTLVKIKDPRAVEPLMKLLKEDESFYLRRKAAHGLGVLGDLQALPVLLEAAQKDADDFVREAAIQALGQLKATQAEEVLFETIEKAEQPGIRRASAFALGAIGKPEALAPLVEALRDSDPSVRAAAAWALGELGQKEAVKSLIALLVEETDNSVKAEVATALGRLEDRRAILPLVEALQDRDPEVQERSAKAIDALSTEIIQRALLLGLKEEVAALSQRVKELESKLQGYQDQTKARLQRLEQRAITGAKAPLTVVPQGGAPSQAPGLPSPKATVPGAPKPPSPDHIPLALAALVPKDRQVIIADIDKFTYTGIRGCRCHIEAYEGQVYKEHKHRAAFKRLKGKDRKNPECLKCHATAFGKKIKGGKPFLKGNQCEACHGPGKEYRARSIKELYRQDPLEARKRSLELGLLLPGVNIVKKKLCAQCHWGGKDPKAPNKCPKSNKVFDFDEYYKEMRHTNVDPIDKIIATLSLGEREKWADILHVLDE